MSDDIRFTAITKKLSTEKEILEGLGTRLEEVADYLKGNYNNQGINEKMSNKIRRIKDYSSLTSLMIFGQAVAHFMIEEFSNQGRKDDADEVVDAVEGLCPMSTENDPFMNKLYEERRLTGDISTDHLDLYTAKELVSATVGRDVSKGLDHKQSRILKDIILDEASKLAEGSFNSKRILAEQEKIRGKISYLRALNRGVEDEISESDENKEDIIKYAKEAVRHYEKAKEYEPGKEVSEGLADSYKLLANIAGTETDEGKRYAQSALDAFKEFFDPDERINDEGDVMSYSFTMECISGLYEGLGDIEKAVECMVKSGSTAARFGDDVFKERACNGIRELYEGQPEKIEEALRLVEKYE